MEISIDQICQKVAAQLAGCLGRSLSCLGKHDCTGYDQFRQTISAVDLAIIAVNDSETCQPLLKQLAEKSLISLIELDAKMDPVLLFTAFAYIEKISADTPLYFCSNTYWYADGNIAKFDTWTHPGDIIPHQKEFAHRHICSRRYYSNQTHFLKRYQGIVSDKHRREFKNEIEYLDKYASVIPEFPRVSGYYESETERWLLRERVRGITLMDAIAQGKPYNPYRVIKDLLKQLTQLESFGLYHTDLRTWNILLTEGGRGAIVDFGALDTTTADVKTSKPVFFSFIKLCYEISHAVMAPFMRFNPSYLNPESYPPEYQALIHGILTTTCKDWSFQLFSKFFHSEPPPQFPWAKILPWIKKQESRYHYFFDNFGTGKQLFVIGKPFYSHLHKLRIRHYEKKITHNFEALFTRKQLMLLENTSRYAGIVF
jgi:tRNA A-37 threonylcarbamoyl transferase component Bud32